MRDPEHRDAYDALDDEFALAATLIEARGRAGLSQSELARRMGSSQAAVAPTEGGRHSPSIRTLKRLGEATGSKLRISFIRA